ncbi:MAG: LamG domain-containing protein [Deltaproteobacteria bacterium]|nr:LamG domain-containing protein [Deltaproteobacteria bacterium]
MWSDLGAEDTIAPYALTWNTLLTPNGTHALTAVARDVAGNTKTATAVSVRVANTVPPQGSGIVAAYGFNATTGTVLVDVSGNNRHGMLVNSPTWVAGRFGNALSFDGSNDYATIGDVDLTGPFTISMWALPKNIGSGCHGSAVMKQYDYGLEVCNGNMYGQVGGGGSSWAASTSYIIPQANVWSHYTLTYDGTTARLYVNAALRSSAAGTHVTNNEPLMIGAWTTASEFFAGLIDEVRIYNRALTPAEIHRDLFTAVTGPYALTVTKAGTGSGTVSGPGVSCGRDCAQSYAGNTTVTLAAVPVAGSTFTGWSGSCTGTSACTLSMTAAKAVTATFTRTP